MQWQNLLRAPFPGEHNNMVIARVILVIALTMQTPPESELSSLAFILIISRAILSCTVILHSARHPARELQNFARFDPVLLLFCSV